MRRDTILFVTTSFPDPEFSAAGIFVGRLAVALADKQPVRVLVPARGMPDFWFAGRIPVRRLRYGPRRWERELQGPGGIPPALARNPFLWAIVPLLLARVALACLWEARRARVIHAHWAISAVIAAPAAWLTRTPLVTTLRGEDINRAARSAVSRFLLRIACRCSARIVCVNSALAIQLSKLVSGFEARTCVIENGVGEAFLGVGPPAAAAPLRILAVGSLIPRKDFMTLVRATARCDRFSVRIVGQGSEEPALKAAVRDAGIDNRVIFQNAVEPDAMPALLAEHDVLVLTSIAEGRPNVVIEAMAAGRVVVATDLPGMRELIEPERNGLLFGVGDVEALVAHLERLAASPGLCRQLGAAARDSIVAAGLTWERAAQRYLALYNENEKEETRCAD